MSKDQTNELKKLVKTTVENYLEVRTSLDAEAMCDIIDSQVDIFGSELANDINCAEEELEESDEDQE